MSTDVAPTADTTTDVAPALALDPVSQLQAEAQAAEAELLRYAYSAARGDDVPLPTVRDALIRARKPVEHFATLVERCKHRLNLRNEIAKLEGEYRSERAECDRLEARIKELEKVEAQLQEAHNNNSSMTMTAGLTWSSIRKLKEELCHDCPDITLVERYKALTMAADNLQKEVAEHRHRAGILRMQARGHDSDAARDEDTAAADKEARRHEIARELESLKQRMIDT